MSNDDEQAPQAWVDPYQEARQDASELYSGPLPPGLNTRRDCTLRGALIFAGVPLLYALIAVVIWLVYPTYVPSGFAAAIGLGLAAASLPLVLFGAMDGFDTYRVCVGSRPATEIGCGGCLLMVVLFPFFHILIVLFGLQYLFRRRILLLRHGPGWGLPLLYSALLGLTLVFAPETHAGSTVYALLLLPVLSDCLLVNTIAGWQDAGKLARPQTHHIQFSLGTLLVLVIGIGAWLTMLVKLFGDQ